ncbi:Predicted membrane protein [Actinomyces viscosus]|uniref:Predicted membrane protein n=1 Tax=Actinomyces viscosus TaxID=1656 RepID=A0A448PNP4_ACTVI|nr:Predicted membrane protein [Actinomyces viscosus]
MLLLIAVANVPSWNKTPDDVGTVHASVADTWWVFVRVPLVDHRAYPLFAMLFGFGLMTMINRRAASGTQAYLRSLPGADAGHEPTPQEVAWAREQATLDARRLVRRRGWWMLLFGFVHGIIFSGDIIGAYGLVAVILAGWLARKRYANLYAIGAVIMLVATSSFLAMGFASPESVAVWSGAQEGSVAIALPWFVTNIEVWTVSLFLQVLVALIVPAAVIGARLADTELITHPQRHRRLLVLVGAGGLSLGALGALHSALTGVLPISEWPWDVAVKEVLGIVGACGWLALLALYAGGPPPDGRLTGLRRLASAVGRRSMTVYLSQTILFGIVFVLIPVLLTGRRLWVGQAAAALIALAVWAATVVLCAVLEHGGHAGPFETLLRTAVARSERKRSVAVVG